MKLILYRLFPDASPVNRFLFYLIRHAELPVIGYILRMAGATRVSARNSVLTPERFHFVMSDLDLAVVAGETRHRFLLEVASRMKKLFPNLGELELFTPQEWDELTLLQQLNHGGIWERIYALRKFKWLTSRPVPGDAYQRAKLQRSVKILLQRLDHTSLPFDGDSLFPEVKNLSFPVPMLPRYSAFLEHEVGSPSKGVTFARPEDAMAFFAILPDSSLDPRTDTLRLLKFYLIRRERLLAIVSLRNQEFRTPEKDYSELRNWIRDLGVRSEPMRRKLFPAPEHSIYT